MTTENVTQESWEEATTRRGADEATVPPAMQEGEVLSSASDEFATRVSSLRYKGYVPYWNAKTGDYNECPQYMRWQIQNIKNPDGSSMYTFVDPKIELDHGLNLFCPLNPKSPEYPQMSDMGFGGCTKEHLPHPEGVDLHVQKSHKRAYAALARLRDDQIRNEDRALQRETLEINKELIQSLAGNVQQSISTPTPEVQVDSQEGICANCGRDFTKATSQGTLMSLMAHKKYCKG